MEAVETANWLTEVAPQAGRADKNILEHLANANNEANPELMRLALKLATGAGKTTVVAMLLAWQTVNAVRRAQSRKFTRGFLIVALHRAVFLTRANLDARVLFTTFSETLANALSTKLRRLISSEPRLCERLEVQTVDPIVLRLYEMRFGRPCIASRGVILDLLKKAAREVTEWHLLYARLHPRAGSSAGDRCRVCIGIP